jgi:hypothetical protein
MSAHTPVIHVTVCRTRATSSEESSWPDSNASWARRKTSEVRVQGAWKAAS